MRVIATMLGGRTVKKESTDLDGRARGPPGYGHPDDGKNLNII
jgi:hypothetical protein